MTRSSSSRTSSAGWPRECRRAMPARKAMEEVTGPVIAIALVLCAVFVPTAFMAGISGQFYQAVRLTIAASTIIRAFNSLTLSPALAALLLKPHGHGEHGHVQQEALPRAGIAIIGGLVAYFFLLAPIGHMVGIEVGGHGAGGAKPHRTRARATLWALRAGVFVGWGRRGMVRRHLGQSTARRVLPRRSIGSSTSRSTSMAGLVAGLLRVSVDRAARLRRPDGIDVPRLPGRARRLHSRTRQGLSGSQCPACPTAPRSIAPTRSFAR